MKNFMLLVMLVLFSLSLVACNDIGKKCKDPAKCPQKHYKERKRRW